MSKFERYFYISNAIDFIINMTVVYVRAYLQIIRMVGIGKKAVPITFTKKTDPCDTVYICVVLVT